METGNSSLQSLGNSEEESSLKYAFDIAVYTMTAIVPPILGVIGITGNVLSFLLMSQKKYEKSTTCFYMRCIAVFDCAYIYGRMFLRYILVIAPQLFTSLQIKEPYCYYYSVTNTITRLFSPWLLVVMAFDRFLALTWPLKAATICTMARAKITTAVIVILSIGLGLLHLLNTYQEKFKFWMCPYHFEEPIDAIYEVVQAIVIQFLPVGCLAIFNTGILAAVYRSKTMTSLNKSTSQDSSVTLATVLLTTYYVLFQIPEQAVTIYWTYWGGVITPDIEQWQRLSNDCSIMFENMNYCLNSYFYMFACKRIRSEWFSMVRSCRRL